MKALAAALVAAQADMPAVQPDATNPHFGNRFVSLDHLIASTKPTLTKHGLSILQFPATVEAQPGLTTTLLHGPSGESMSDTSPLILAKQDMQGLGGALTYMRRYAWAAVLGISAEGDDDGNTASAPGTGASPVSGSTGAVGGSGGSGAGSSAPTSRSSAPPSSTNGEKRLEWKYGPHSGKTIAETPLDFVTEYAATKTGFMADKCKEFLAENGGSIGDPDDGIPFAPTIDGLGN